MKVLNFQAHNVLRIKDVNFDLDGRHLFLVGGENGQGKTSALAGLRMALCGRSGSDYPEVALRDGETEGWVKVSLGGETETDGLDVELYLKRGRSGNIIEKFRVLDKTGREAPSPRELLNRLYSMRAFDPLAFEHLGRKDKRDMLCKLVGIDLAAWKKEHDAVFDERTGVNRDGKKLAAVFEQMPFYSEVKDQAPLNVENLVQELNRRQAVNKDNSDKRKSAQDFADDIEWRKQHEAELRGKIDELMAELTEYTQTTSKLLVEKGEMDVAVASLRDENEQEVLDQITSAGGVNAKIAANKERDIKNRELIALRNKSQSLSEQIAEIDRKQHEALQNANWPIDGLSVDADGVLFNGLPLEQECTSKRTLISTRIGMALNPTLRLLVCQGGNDLGNDAMDALQKVLEENDFQMLLEVVTRSSEDESRCAVVIEDGTQLFSTKA